MPPYPNEEPSSPANKEEGSGANGEGSNAAASSSSPENPLANVKHPLQHSWTLWYFRNDRSKTWEDNLREVSTKNGHLLIKIT